MILLNGVLKTIMLTAIAGTGPSGVVSISVEVLDVDADGVVDRLDNRPHIFNPDQATIESNSIGDVGEPGAARGAVEIGSSCPVLLYDVDFGTPPHTVGQPPVVGEGRPPRDRPDTNQIR